MKNLYHRFLAWLGPKLYGRPSEKIFIIGITGTKGKSTTIELLSSIFDLANLKNATLSSLHRKIGNERSLNESGNTMPGRFYIQKFLREAVDAGCKYAIIEVTSQGVVQNRHKYIDFDAAALTGLHPEHIEAHGSFENYRGAKVNFFRYVAKQKRKERPLFFINSADENAHHFEAAGASKGKIIKFSKAWLEQKYLKGDKLGAWFDNPFNLENAALATAIATSQGLSWEIIEKALSSFRGVPGRLETFSGQVRKKDGSSHNIQVLLDYAYTPVSLEGVYSFLKKKQEKSPGNLICVFGSAGGGRDKWKRAELGKIAEKYCQSIVLTGEDPYAEDPLEIIKEIQSGMSRPEKAKVLPDRKKAIEWAIQSAIDGDIVTVTGMGSQKVYYGPKGKIPWSEKRIIQNAFSK